MRHAGTIGRSLSEQARATLAKALGSSGGIIGADSVPIVLVDEFTTALDRPSAKQLCLDLKDYMRKSSIKLLLATWSTPTRRGVSCSTTLHLSWTISLRHDQPTRQQAGV